MVSRFIHTILLLLLIPTTVNAQPYLSINPRQSNALAVYPCANPGQLVTVTNSTIYQWDVNTGRCTRQQVLAGRTKKVRIGPGRDWLLVLQEKTDADVLQVYSTHDLSLKGSLHLDSLLEEAEKDKLYKNLRANSFAFDAASGWMGICTFNRVLFYNIQTHQKILPATASRSAFTAIAVTQQGWLVAGEDYATQTNEVWSLLPAKSAIFKKLERLYEKSKVEEIIPDPVTGQALFVLAQKRYLLVDPLDGRSKTISTTDDVYWYEYCQYYWEKKQLFISNENGCFQYNSGSEFIQRVHFRRPVKKSYDWIETAEKTFFLPWNLSKQLFIRKEGSGSLSLFVIDSVVAEDNSEPTRYTINTILSFGMPGILFFSSMLAIAPGEILLQNINTGGLLDLNRLKLEQANKEFPIGFIPINNTLQYLPVRKQFLQQGYINSGSRSDEGVLLYNRNGWLDTAIFLFSRKASTWYPHVFTAPDSDTLYYFDIENRKAYVQPPGSPPVFQIALPDSTAEFWPVTDKRFIKLPNGHFLFGADLLLHFDPYKQTCKIIDKGGFGRCKILAYDAVHSAVLYKIEHKNGGWQSIMSYDYVKGKTLNLMNDYTSYKTEALCPFTWKGASAWLMGLGNGEVQIRSPDLSTVLESFTPVKNTGLSDVLVDQASQSIVVLMKDYTIRMFDMFTLQPIVTLYTGEQGKNWAVIAIDSNSHYYLPSQQASLLNWVYKDQPYDYSVFDKYYNQPAELLSRVRSTDTNYINMVQKATETRLKRSSRDLNNKKIGELPVCMIERNAADFTTDSSFVDLPIRIKAGKWPVQRWQIFANEVPLLYSKLSFFVTPLAAGRDTTLTYRLELPHEVSTHISVKVFDEQNNASLAAERWVYRYRNQQAEKERFWYLGFGSSRYKDSIFNLRYAAKDVQDIVKQATSTINSWRRGGARSFTDSLVIMQNIIQGFAWLADQAAINDKIIISFSGHGITNKNGKFYFMLYDSDFKNPESTALPFDVIFEFLKIIPCRNKLVLLDACESGDFDNDGFIVEQKPADTATIKITGVKGIELPGADSKANSPGYLEWMKEYFADLEGESSATIIGATSGISVALENEQWRNGIFTFAFVKGLFEFEADLDKDNTISLIELRDYITTTVFKETNGRQRPSVRNLDSRNNWTILEKYWMK